MKAMNEYNSVLESKNKDVFSEMQGFPLTDRDDFIVIMRLFAERMLGKLVKDPNIRIVGEKTPDNTRYLHVLSDMFPQAKFIHIVRDPRDVAVSGWCHNKRIAPQWLNEKYGSFSNYALDIARLWELDITMARKHKDTFPDNFFEVRYEDLLKNIDPVVNKLLKFLDTEHTKKIVANCIKQSSFETLSKGRKRGTSDESSFFRKGIAGDWSQYFDKSMRTEFEKIVGKMMQSYGYKTGDPL